VDSLASWGTVSISKTSLSRVESHVDVSWVLRLLHKLNETRSWVAAGHSTYWRDCFPFVEPEASLTCFQEFTKGCSLNPANSLTACKIHFNIVSHPQSNCVAFSLVNKLPLSYICCDFLSSQTIAVLVCLNLGGSWHPKFRRCATIPCPVCLLSSVSLLNFSTSVLFYLLFLLITYFAISK
jgi:hypothetical protein